MNFYKNTNCIYVGRDRPSVRRLATGWRVRGSNPGWDETVGTHPDWPWGPPIFLYSGYRFFLLGVKRAGRGINHPPRSTTEVKERVQQYLFSPSGPSFYCIQEWWWLHDIITVWSITGSVCLACYCINIKTSIVLEWHVTQPCLSPMKHTAQTTPAPPFICCGKLRQYLVCVQATWNSCTEWRMSKYMNN